MDDIGAPARAIPTEVIFITDHGSNAGYIVLRRLPLPLTRNDQKLPESIALPTLLDTLLSASYRDNKDVAGAHPLATSVSAGRDCQVTVEERSHLFHKQTNRHY